MENYGQDTLDFCTLGMFIIDEIHFPPPQPPVFNIIGGAGSYSALGARLFSPPPLSSKVGWVVHAGADFPEPLRKSIMSWNTSCALIETPDRLTTRGFNKYGHDEFRGFRYLTPKLRLDHMSLPQSHLKAKCFHLICSPSRCVNLVKGIIAEREKLLGNAPQGSMLLPQPLFVWEPVPDICVPDELENCYNTLQYVDVISPNHVELAAFFGESGILDDPKLLRRLCNNLRTKGFRGSGGAVVVRTGKRGCFVADGDKYIALPAYYEPVDGVSENSSSSEKVVDPTGGGNAFLGGFCIALARGRQLGEFSAVETAALYGSVAASFAIEQVGMPELSSSEDRTELWNGESAFARLYEFEQRI
ncbi:MAG: hypothetical protein FRX48_09152 [Lasallia pustulata]|uniref:Carbohydrate kinase PfkB domain-containing protein n=1 Tax=Lasallia pustulata TaxID=136370 RepID=A0A5M8PDM2_9LECA|nr:MAG: hypothetical protein FRX48_09152 [Lasallia pustulata]